MSAVVETTDVPYSVDELRACLLSREFDDGERVWLGANVGPGRAALILAHLLRGPNMRILLGMGWTNFADAGELNLQAGMVDFRNASGAEAYLRMDTWLYDFRAFGSSAFIVGGIQIDRFGNTNLIGIGSDHSKLTLRGPGPVGTTASTAYAERFYILPTRHSPEVFVERCDFVSSVGWDRGGADARERLGLIGGGPKLCVTELCVFDFDDETKAMRLKSLHPGRTVAEVVAATGFEIVIPEHVEETEPPRPDEIELLRRVVDPTGILRG